MNRRIISLSLVAILGLSACAARVEGVSPKAYSRIPASEFKDIPVYAPVMDTPDFMVPHRVVHILTAPHKSPVRHLKRPRTTVKYYPAPSPLMAQKYALRVLGPVQYSCIYQIFSRESGWRVNAHNASGAYGIPQALPGSKMASFGSDWMTNPITQVRWGIHYVNARYGSACSAWSFWQIHRWY